MSNSDESAHSDNGSEVIEAEELLLREEIACAENENVNDTEITRKRMRNYQSHKSFMAKERVERGLERFTKKGKKVIRGKVFKGQIICKCLDDKKQKLSCAHKIGIERQKVIFDSYYQGMSWTQKTLFIRGHVKRRPVKTKKSLVHSLR